jgi:bifunctional UDP-N-acetylglucosamine pyrophosphorylase/glucosamine-1-phosphate N-acetyltransferase
MKSQSLPKVLHSFAGRSMLGHVLAATDTLQPATTSVVIGHRGEEVAAHLAELQLGRSLSGQPGPLIPVTQHEQHGTGHAVRVAMQQLRPDASEETGLVLVVPGDAPLLRGETLAALLAEHAANDAAATMLTSRVADPTGYGRVVRAPDSTVAQVVEDKDASADQLAITEVSALVYVFDAPALRDAVSRLSRENSQQEEYLPEVISIFVAEGKTVRALAAPASETAGVNDRIQLSQAHRAYNDRLLAAHMLDGVTVIDPATTWVDVDVRLAADVTLRPNVRLEGATQVAADAVIGPDCTLADTSVGRASHLRQVVANQARIGAGVTVGPYAYLRPGTELADEVHVGTFVEIKASDVGFGSKVPHLTYVGDASIGEQSNIGASTVFVNYDGVKKRRSSIGSYARTGADNMFVAPVSVGDGAYTAAGSVIAEDVPPGALAIARSRQRNVDGWVAKRRAGTPADRAAQAAQAAQPIADSAHEVRPPEPATEPTSAEPTSAEPTSAEPTNLPHPRDGDF